EVFTWKVLGLHHKPIGIYNLEGYYDPLINLLNHMIEKGFLNSKYMNHIIVESDINKLLEKIEDDLHPEFRDDSGSHL
ncbi:MAG: LOG family protein, partial [Leptospiraceae bacterium]|nr:LOG family protein [Leptospiraceae bacterium]